MFADIAPTYDFLNHFLSANRDRAWRREAVRLAGIGPRHRVLDVCCGTGDLALEAWKRLGEEPAGVIVGADFCPEMVHRAMEKKRILERRRERPAAAPFELLVADTLRLPFPEGAFDFVTVGFGIRNVSSLEAGLREMRRVLRPGGRAVILEFATPRSAWFRKLFEVYFHQVLPRLGRWLSSAPDPDLDNAYKYLPDSVDLFPEPQVLCDVLRSAGFAEVAYRLLTFGIAAVHLGVK
ncbi:MAG: class I SAM-dependent methyltransferase [Planctomycetes bacterium]|nr:class I SAM-dependent methyltransferase [Planctomycetota bacterium]